MKWKETNENAYFAASNSRNGFHSYYEHCFRDRVEHLYCIKGGPGTGKSTLMRRVAQEGERRGYRVEYYYCSSDADSLDGVLLFGDENSFGVIDATAPHAFEPRLPGAREEIVDLGQFWNAEQLTDSMSEIAELNRKKTACYRATYHHLTGVGELSDVLQDIVTPCLDMVKLGRVVARLCRGNTAGQDGEVQIRLHDSIGMRGRVRLNSYFRESDRLCIIEDYFDSAYALTGMIAQRAIEMRQDMRISYHPVLPDRVDALLLTSSKTAFVVCSAEETASIAEQLPHARMVSMHRMIDKTCFRAVRDEVRRVGKLRGYLLDEACVQLNQVAEAHFNLEKIYTAAMDFGAKEQFTASFCRRMFDSKK